MSSCLSLHTCWLPRIVFFPRIFIRSTLSTTSTSHNASSHRSASRFSLKIARFLFLKERINHNTSTTPTIVPLSTHAHYSKSETTEDMQELARSFLLSLEPG
jgi:hypothetical protein